MSIAVSASIRTRAKLFSAPLMAATRAFLGHPALSQLIPDHLILLHQITRASVPLMQTAYAEMRRAKHDPLAPVLCPYLLKHIEEEMHHDEWTLDDLREIGVDADTVLLAPPPANVAALVGAQYYWIYHGHPVALVGYMVMLESNAPSMETVDIMKKNSGLPERLFRTHRVHAELDPGHEADLYSLIDELPLTEMQQRLIAYSVTHTGLMLADCFAHPEMWNRQ
jgi:Iron-containing redox enzyme